MPALLAAMVPELTMPPPAELTPNCPIWLSQMPWPPAVILPELLILAAKVESKISSMPWLPAEIVPLLVMPPLAEPEPNCATWEAQIARDDAAMVPELLMPPTKVETL